MILTRKAAWHLCHAGESRMCDLVNQFGFLGLISSDPWGILAGIKVKKRLNYPAIN